MLGISLIQAGFLAAAAAAAVPVLIHLLMKPRAKPAVIGTLRFLKRVLQQTTRRRKIRHWMLLTLRTAALLLLALLFARPYLSAPGGLGRDREVVLLIDQSASMATLHSGRTLFACAQRAAEKILRDLPEGTTVHLAYFDDRVWSGNSNIPDSKGTAPFSLRENRDSPQATKKSQLSPNSVDWKRQPGYAGTDFGQALCWARDLFTTSARPQRKAYLLTDLQRTGQHGTPCKGFPEDAEIEVIELGKPLMGNLAVDKVETAQTTIRGREPTEVTAHVSNAGALAVHNVRVRLRLDSGGPRPIEQTQTVSIEAGSYEQVRFTLPIDRSGLYQGYVEVDADDGLPGDDRRWLAFEARPPDRILLVDGEPGSSVFSDETYYLEMALRLALPGKGRSPTPFEPVHLVRDGRTNLPELETYQAVVLCNVAKLDVADVARLRQYVSWGGRLLIFTGGQVEPESSAPLGRAGLLPAAVTGMRRAGVYRFRTWEKDHPIFLPLSDPQQGDLRRLVFRKITRLTPAAGAKVLATAGGGDPLLVETRLGRGAVLMFATAVDRDWSDWPQARLFVPLVHRFVGYLTGRLPEEQRVRAAPTGPGGDNPPGITCRKDRVFVRNVEPAESRIERYSQKQFRDEFQLARAKIAEAPEKNLAAVLPPGAQRPNELWTSVIWFLLAVLTIETFVANRTHA
ncbi:MAG: BatA domain-containing protein [Pirellulales bacterium]|nr:BatA domain-containing protein [Pirellulales bacterium]